MQKTNPDIKIRAYMWVDRLTSLYLFERYSPHHATRVSFTSLKSNNYCKYITKMNYQQNIDIFFKAFDEKFKTIIPNIIAETAVEYYKFNFKRKAWNGVPWPALNTKYAARKTKGRGQILIASSKLFNSIRPTETTPSRIVISAGNSNVPYARVHNEGLHVSGVRTISSYTNRNFMGKGKPVQIKAHTRSVNYTMPQRQFIGVSRELNTLLHQRLTKALNK